MVEADSGQVEHVDAMPLEPTKIIDSGRHIIRYTTVCTNFVKIVRPFMNEDEGHSIVIKHLGEMQHQLNELKKRKGLNCDSEVQLDVDAVTNNKKDGVSVKHRKKKAKKTSITQDGPDVMNETSGMKKVNYFNNKFCMLYMDMCIYYQLGFRC